MRNVSGTDGPKSLPAVQRKFVNDEGINFASVHGSRVCLLWPPSGHTLGQTTPGGDQKRGGKKKKKKEGNKRSTRWSSKTGRKRREREGSRKQKGEKNVKGEAEHAIGKGGGCRWRSEPRREREETEGERKTMAKNGK
ncbi:hypothetical protein, partial [Klebsiella pneumoniae]|uniref:hypothetical protein n=1 Tax=Klebsiella pneumoniae TaxID=573 RepID=UPI001F4B218F